MKVPEGRQKILVIGQTPPPYGGQAIMIENLLRANFQQVQFFHVRMAFSTDMDEIGKFKLAKVLILFKTIGQIIYHRFRHHIRVVYYPPAGPDRVPMYRDILVLGCTRWLFRKTVFHFHAGGISELYPGVSAPLRYFYRRAYFHPDASIRISEYNPEDGKAFGSKRNYVVPNGVEDYWPRFQHRARGNPDRRANLLYVGVVRESKGILVLLESCRLLKEKDRAFTLTVVGKFESPDFEQLVRRRVAEYGLQACVSFAGVHTGEQKFNHYFNADIFCFPSYFESETFGLVLLEAMQFHLPTVATRWRGIPSVVEDGKSGFLVPVQDARAMADQLALLIDDPARRREMGRYGRELYCKRFTLTAFNTSMETVFSDLTNHN
ncbi:MAG: glycosyltransferase family 4 protein [Ferruginibacter sp.]|nr:glycosyltransferase family 4 protein [Cytophagales bacterium]